MARKKKIEEDEDLDLGEVLDAEDNEDAMQWYAQYEASKIVDFRDTGRGALFLGNIYQTMQLTYDGNPLGITAVLDVSTENDYEKNPDVLYLRVPFPDGHEIPPEKFAQCMAFLKFCWEKNMTILVNCAAGISRSTSIVVSFLYYSGLGAEFTPPFDTMEKILDYVRLVRPIVSPAPRVFNSCKQWLRVWPYDGSHGGYTPPKHKLDNTVVANMLKFHVNPDCEVRQSILANDNQERHLLKCICKPEGLIR
jgi:hypothetical protein